MEQKKIIITGIGGQGIIFVTRLLAQTATILDHPVMISETHGMSQRGGSVVSHLKIGGDQAPLIHRGTADILIGLNADETVRQLPMLRPEGVIFVNTDSPLPAELDPHLKRLDLKVFTITASQLAVELGSAAVTNVIMIGFAAASPSLPIPFDVFIKALKNVTSRGLEMNLKALEIGYQNGQEVFSQEKISQ